MALAGWLVPGGQPEWIPGPTFSQSGFGVGFFLLSVNFHLSLDVTCLQIDPS